MCGRLGTRPQIHRHGGGFFLSLCASEIAGSRGLSYGASVWIDPMTAGAYTRARGILRYLCAVCQRVLCQSGHSIVRKRKGKNWS